MSKYIFFSENQGTIDIIYGLNFNSMFLNVPEIKALGKQTNIYFLNYPQTLVEASSFSILQGTLLIDLLILSISILF